MLRHSLLPSITAVLSILFILASYISFVKFHQGESRCDGVRMIPGYAWLQDFNSQSSRMGSKYRMYYYREGEIDTTLTPSGTPVLFIPGNAGSYAQARSIASYCSKRTAGMTGFTQDLNEFLGGYIDKRPGGRLSSKFGNNLQEEIDMRLKETQFDFFTADFSEDFTAFHGKTLLDQAEYVNDAISYILNMYDDQPGNPAPSSIIIIGHSMGGIVARTLVTLPNYRSDSINTIITLSTPHILPPLTFDKDITLIYDKVNQYWRYAFQANRKSENPLKDVSLISITGGQSDTMVPSEYTDVSSLVPLSNGFTTFTYSIPNVWTGIDHLAILWCAQFRQKLGNVLFHISDPFSSRKTLELRERMEVFEAGFLSGLDDNLLQPVQETVATTELVVTDLDSERYTDGRINVLNLGSGVTPVYMLGYQNDLASVHVYTNANVYPESGEEGLTVLLCDFFGKINPKDSQLGLIDASRFSTNEKNLSLLCTNIHPKIIKLPQSTTDSSYPFDNSGQNTFTMLMYDKLQLKGWNLLVLVDQYKHKSDKFVTTTISKTPIVVNGTLSDFFFGYNVNLENTGQGYTRLTIPALRTNMFSLDVRLEPRKECHFNTTYFSPLVRQSIDQPLDSKFHINVVDKTITISHHGNSPFLPYKTTNSNALQLEIFAPPLECEPLRRHYYKLTLSINWKATLGNFFLKYRTLLATWPQAATCLVVLLQFREYNKTGIFITFNRGISILFKSLLVFILVGLSVFHIVSVCFPSIVHGIVNIFRFPSVQSNVDALTAYSSDWRQNTIFLGVSDTSLWFVGPLFFLVSLGLVVLVQGVDLTIMALITSLMWVILKRRSILVSPRDRNSFSSLSILRRVIPTFISIFVLYLIPYQVMFIFVVAFLVITVERFYLISETCSLKEHHNVNLYNFTMSLMMLFTWPCVINAPMLSVWIRNLSLKWSFVFSTYNNVFSIIPIILVVINVYNGHMIPRANLKYEKVITFFILGYTALYAVLFGFTHAYMGHHLTNLFCGWLLVLYIKDFKTFKTEILKENIRKF